jgi:hypothetical protein
LPVESDRRGAGVSHISRKTSELWGTRISLRIEISLPHHRLPDGVKTGVLHIGESGHRFVLCAAGF